MDFYIENYDSLTASEKDLLHFILDNEGYVMNTTAQKLAIKCGISKTVVINLCQKLGFEGFNELKYFLKSNRHKNELLVDDNYKARSNLLTIVEKTLELNKEEILRSVAKKISNAKCVYVIARGTSKATAVYLTHLLLMMNIKCINIPDMNLMDLIARKIEHDEVIIALSLSGETAAIVNTARIVKAHGNTLITITAFNNSTLSALSDYSLYFCANSTDTKINDDISRIGMFTIADYLVSYVKAA